MASTRVYSFEPKKSIRKFATPDASKDHSNRRPGYAAWEIYPVTKIKFSN